MKEKMKLQGMLLAGLASSLWSISGISGEILFKKYNFSSDWLVSIRTLISGILLFMVVIFIEKKSILKPLKNKKDFIGIILFGTAGMYLVQYTYFKTIELSNVSFSTILQFTAPFFIFIYESIKNRKIPAVSTLLLLSMTVLGVVFIATKGKISSLSVSPEALLLGLISAIMIAFYSIYPKAFEKIWKYNGSWMGNDCGKHNFKYCSSNLENTRGCKFKIYHSSSNCCNFRNIYCIFNLHCQFKLHFFFSCGNFNSFWACTCCSLVSSYFWIKILICWINWIYIGFCFNFYFGKKIVI